MDRNGKLPLIIWLYDRLAGLYPPGFRKQFSAEQREVFLQALEDASAAGPKAALRLLAREFAGLPGVLARCYWKAFRQGGWEKLLAGWVLLVLFLLPANESISRLGPGIGGVLMVFLLGGLLVTLLSGILLGFPRWALPIPGFILAAISFYVSMMLLGLAVLLILPRRDYSMLALVPRLLYGSLWNGLHLFLFMLVTFFLFFIARLIGSQRFPRRWRHARRWSDVSFMLYGGTFWLAMMTIDEYQHEGPVMIPAAFVLLLGAYFFLRAATPWRGVGALVAGTVLAFVIIAVGKYFIVPIQGDFWEGWFEAHPLEIERWFEALSSLLILIWMVPLLLIPAAWRPFIEEEPAGE